MSKVKGAGFGVRFYRRAVPGRQMTDRRGDKPTKAKDTPPQEITEPFPRREMQPVIDVPDQFMKLELFESWPPENAATKLAKEIQKAKQVLKKPEVHEWEGLELISWDKPITHELEFMEEKPAVMRTVQTSVQKQFTAYKKPPALQIALDKVKAKAEAKKLAVQKAEQEAAQKPVPKKSVATDITKETALWVAAENGDCHKIRLLVLEGADLEMRDSYGRTAINIAMQYNQKDAIKTLMAAKEMRKMAKDGALPNMNFFRRLSHEKTGT